MHITTANSHIFAMACGGFWNDGVIGTIYVVRRCLLLSTLESKIIGSHQQFTVHSNLLDCCCTINILVGTYFLLE